MARMEREDGGPPGTSEERRVDYGDDVLHLVIASGYPCEAGRDRDIKRYLNQHHPELLAEFQAIIATASLDQAGGVGQG